MEKSEELSEFDLAARKYLGHERLRPAQHEVSEALATGNDVLFRMPTGAGKSDVIWTRALMSERLWLVIEPTKALMDNHVRRLGGLLEASGERVSVNAVHSDNSVEDRRRIRDEIANGVCRVLYVAPERLQNVWFLKEISKKVGGGAIDEVQHIFKDRSSRPSYPGMRYFVQRMRNENGDFQICACSGTMSRDSVDYIKEIIPFRNLIELMDYDLERPNLEYSMRLCAGYDEKLADLWPRLEEHVSNGEQVIIYRTTPKQVMQLVGELGKFGAFAFHGQMEREYREDVLRGFSDGEIPILVANSALGAGFDKPDVRAVYEFDVPGDLFDWVQHSGRAGRDGEPAVCRAYVAKEDFRVHQFLLQQQMGLMKSPDFIRDVYGAVERHVSRLSKEVRDEHGFSKDVFKFNRDGFYRSFTCDLKGSKERFAMRQQVENVMNMFVEKGIVDVFNGCVRFRRVESEDLLHEEIAEILRNRLKVGMALIAQMGEMVNELADLEGHGVKELTVSQAEIFNRLNAGLDLDAFAYLDGY